MRVLIGVATYPTEPHIYPATQAAIDALDYDGETRVHLYEDDDPALSAYDNLTAKHNRMRADTLAFGADALLTIEADIIPPPDALAKLAAAMQEPPSVVYGLYCARSNGMPLCFPQIDGFYGESIAHEPRRWRGGLAAGEIVTSEGAGFGCTLIHRRVLEAIKFARPRTSRRNESFADDWPFAIAVKEAGFVSAHHLGVLCGHIRRDGTVLWPAANVEGFCRVERTGAMRDGTGNGRD